mgnify:CR=1 FL=1
MNKCIVKITPIHETVEATDNGYEIVIDGNWPLEGKVLKDITASFANQGWDFKGDEEKTLKEQEHYFYLTKAKGDELEDDSLDDVDDLDTTPKGDELDDLDNLLIDNDLSTQENSEEFTDEEIEDFLFKTHLVDNPNPEDVKTAVKKIGGFLKTGKDDGNELTEDDWNDVKAMFESVLDGNKVAKALKDKYDAHFNKANKDNEGALDIDDGFTDEELEAINGLDDFLASELDVDGLDNLLIEDEINETVDGSNGDSNNGLSDDQIAEYALLAGYKFLSDNDKALLVKSYKSIIEKGEYSSGGKGDSSAGDKLNNKAMQVGLYHPVAVAIVAAHDKYANTGSNESTDDQIKNTTSVSDNQVLNDAIAEWEKTNKEFDKLGITGADVELISEQMIALDKYKEAVNENDTDGVKAATTMLKNALKEFEDRKNKKTKKTVEPISIDNISDEVLQPLTHDDSKFPPNLTQAQLDNAIANGKSAGGHGGLNTSIITIGDKKYICKYGAGKKSNIIKNGYNADMAYRAGGIHAPDANLYEFGDGKTYKLSEFIEGEKLIDALKKGGDAKRKEISKELLKGYPLDVLFSNYDVLGTSPEASQDLTITDKNGMKKSINVAFDNIIVGKDGHCYRIDNDGAFSMTGTGGHKNSFGGNMTTQVNSEKWDNWDEREWIDDFRTMRRNEKNQGIFDDYSTADIFLAASKIDYIAVSNSLPEQLLNAMIKPMNEMKEMGKYAWSSQIAGYKANRSMSWTDDNGTTQTIECDPLSMALDAIYNANKKGARPFLQNDIDWVDLGWVGGNHSSPTAYVPKIFSKPPPPEPKAPPKGIDVANEVLQGVKTIAYHVAKGDFTPNKDRINKALAVKPFVEVLAETGNQKAVGILDAIIKIEEAGKTGYKKVLSFDTPNGFFDAAGLSLIVDDDNTSIFNKAIEPKHKQWEKDIRAWKIEKKTFDDAEQAKAQASGAAPAKSFQLFENAMVDANYNTDGIAQNNGDHNVNLNSKHGQKSMSWTEQACRKKVRQYAMMGLSLNDMDFANGDKVFYNGNTDNGGNHVSGSGTDGKKQYQIALKYYRNHPSAFKKDMQAYAVHKAMMVIMHANMKNKAIDHDLHTVFVMRGEHKQAWGKDGKGSPTTQGIISPYPIDSSASAQVNNNGAFGSIKVGWKLPIWRITDSFMIDNGSESEICINPINIPYPPMFFDSSTSGIGWEHCMSKYNAEKKVKEVDKKLGKKSEE